MITLSTFDSIIYRILLGCVSVILQEGEREGVGDGFWGKNCVERNW
jgi:hypothetical protein